MSKQNGFLQLRRGVWEHVRDGRMSVTEVLAFIYICCEADTRTGIWKGCAKSLSGELGIPERTARDVLEKMEHGDYIRRFAVPGSHVCYPILIHKFLITDGKHNGEQLNAIESKSPADLAYFSREQSVEDSVEHGVEDSAAQKRIENREERKRKNLAAEPAPLAADPRYKQFIDFAHQAFEGKHNQKPTWGDKDFTNLSKLLKRRRDLTLQEMTRRWGNFLASTEWFTAKQGDSLAYFATHFDAFIDGPILEKNYGRGTNAANRRDHQTAAVSATPGKYRKVPVHQVQN